MRNKNLEDLKEFYNLDLEKVALNIVKSHAKLVLLQFPDWLKQYAISIVDFLEKKTSKKVPYTCREKEGIQKMKSILTFQKWTKKMSKNGLPKMSLLTEIFCDDI